MKTILTFLTIGMLILFSFSVAAINIENTNFYEPENTNMNDYTHTVFVEIAGGQFCSPCDDWNTNVYNAYKTGKYNFEYVEMVIWGFGGFGDILNSDADQWKDQYGITGAPDSIFDGNYERITGNFPNVLSDKLNATGQRAVKNLDANISFGWHGNGVIQVDIEITNNDTETYNGYIRVPITEVNSRYKTLSGGTYHNVFLDYAFQEDVSIPAGQNFTDSILWDGNEHEDNYGDDFGDINPDNIKVIMGVFNDEDGFVDETVAADQPINYAPEKPSIDGPTRGNINSAHTYELCATDPDGDDIYYCVNWGDGTGETCLGPFPSDTCIPATHTWTTRGNYQINVKAKDVYDYESEETTLNVRMPRSKDSSLNEHTSMSIGLSKIKDKSYNNNIRQLLENIFDNFPLLRQLLHI